MHQRKSKKILLYFFLLIILGTFNNHFLIKLELPKLKNIEVLGLNEDINQKITNDLIFLKFQNLFFLKSPQIKKIIDTNNSVENYTVFKKFPSTIVIKIEETKILANLYKLSGSIRTFESSFIIELVLIFEQLVQINNNIRQINFFNIIYLYI